MQISGHVLADKDNL